MAIDLEQFHQVFFEESLEGLDIMEQTLLGIDTAGADAEAINTIFRAAHSIKGGSGTFGFTAITEFTHVAETLLDEIRDNKRQLTTEIVELLLQSSDCLRNMIVSLQAGETIDNTESQPLVAAFEQLLNTSSDDEEPSTAATSTAEPQQHTTQPPQQQGSQQNDILAASIDTMLNGSTPSNSVPDSPQPTEPTEQNTSQATDAASGSQWKIHFFPEPQVLLTGNEPSRIFRELESLGKLTVEADASNVPTFDLLTADECFLKWTLLLETEAGKDDIVEVFDWVLDECKLDISRVGESPAQDTPATPEQPKIPEQQPATPTPAVAENPAPTPAASAETKTAAASPAASAANSSIRVGIDKVDSLINLVGELVITQSMLSELGNNFEVDKLDRLSSGLEQLLQNTKELQESVMRIRMLPISFAFNRFPRMIRDLAAKTGKQVELKLSGEQTELDKTVMEQIGDPLVHLVRNAIDHGIETAEERLANGKPEQGTILLDAYHQGGNIVIEIRDDGRGIDANVILAKAIEKGLVDGSEDLPESRIFELIFEPGFSTAAVVSDISGRGVGMDVVRRNIKSLGGRIEITSKLGSGSTFKVFLPLTLAILDGQLVRVGTETYIVPLISIVESLQIRPELVNQVSGDMVLYRLREDNVPIIPISEEFGIDADNTELSNGLLVVVEGEGQKIGLLVDDLLAQQQVVIKSLESNYKRVEGISGATILGDGSVSMILDIPGLIRKASTRAKNRTRSSKQYQAA